MHSAAHHVAVQLTTVTRARYRSAVPLDGVSQCGPTVQRGICSSYVLVVCASVVSVCSTYSASASVCSAYSASAAVVSVCSSYSACASVVSVCSSYSACASVVSVCSTYSASASVVSVCSAYSASASVVSAQRTVRAHLWGARVQCTE